MKFAIQISLKLVWVLCNSNSVHNSKIPIKTMVHGATPPNILGNNNLLYIHKAKHALGD